MAQHGYLHDTYDSDDFGRSDERERGWADRDDERGWRRREDERGWRGREWDEGDRDRSFMFEGRDRGRRGERDQDSGRGFFERAGDEVRSWFSDDDDRDSGRWRERSWERDPAGSRYGRERGSGGFVGERSDYGEGRRRYSAHPDEHYRSWRQKQIEALDRDYEEYCRECEQRFHQDFDSWRQNRRKQSATGAEGALGESHQSGSSSEVMELDKPAAQGGEIPGATSSPTGAATLGTNNSENASETSTTGRARR